MKTIFQILFSFLVWTFSFVWMALLALATFLVLPIAPYRKSSRWITIPGFALIAKTVTFGKFRVIYDRKFDPERRSVFCQNHVNLLDAHSAATAIHHPFCGVMHAWQFKIPFYGWLMTLSKGIAVPKRQFKKDTVSQIIQMAKERKKEGFSILVFPEGGRTLTGKVQKFHRGIFFIARDAGYPVVPVAVRGMYEVNRKGSWLFSPGDVSVYVGPQFETEGLSDEKINELTAQMQGIVARFVETGEIPHEGEPL